MKEIMYNQSSFFICVMLFISMLITIEFGYRLGLKQKKHADESYKSHIDALQSSLLGILALLIAFTFSIALQRFDSRSDAVVDEANAIGTAYLRAELLPSSIRVDVKQSLHNYLDLRVQASQTSLDHNHEREILLIDASKVLDTLWQRATQAAEIDANPVTTGLFIQSLNEVIDSFGRRMAAVDRHVPEAVLLLLAIVLLTTGSILGFNIGVTGHRPSLVGYVMVGLIILLIFIIIDLDHPRRGIIQVSQKNLVDLQKSISASTPSKSVTLKNKN